jgi:hypothetical protein
VLDLVSSFYDRISSLNVGFEIHNTDAREVATRLTDGTFARIEVSLPHSLPAHQAKRVAQCCLGLQYNRFRVCWDCASPKSPWSVVAGAGRKPTRHTRYSLYECRRRSTDHNGGSRLRGAHAGDEVAPSIYAHDSTATL